MGGVAVATSVSWPTAAEAFYLWSLLVVDLMMVLAVSIISHILRELGAPRIPGTIVLPLGRVRVSIPLGAIIVVNATIIALALWFQRTEPQF